MTNIDKTLAERGSRYGEFPEHARITQNIKNAMADSCNWEHLEDDMKEALEMVAHKAGRILNGDPSYIDSWTDIIGYTRLVEKRLIDEQNTAKVFAFPEQVGTSTAPAKAAAEQQAAAEEECSCSACALNKILSAFQKIA